MVTWNPICERVEVTLKSCPPSQSFSVDFDIVSLRISEVGQAHSIISNRVLVPFGRSPIVQYLREQLLVEFVYTLLWVVRLEGV